MMLTNSFFTMVDDEVAIIDKAAHPASATLKLFLSGGGQHEHPPLSDLLLHGWLVLTHGTFWLLRVPSTAFYLAGAWFLVMAARKIAGERAGFSMLTLIVLWPFGFHFGRIAGWYSFTFMLVCLATLLYVRYLDRPTIGRWVCLVVCALALIYSNYFGWAILACIGMDVLLRNRRDRSTWLLVATTVSESTAS